MAAGESGNQKKRRKKSPAKGVQKAATKQSASRSVKKGKNKGTTRKSPAKVTKKNVNKPIKKAADKGKKKPSSPDPTAGTTDSAAEKKRGGRKAESLMVNLAQIIKLFGVTSQAFNKWKAKETFPKDAVLGYNKFDLMAVFTWYREDIIGGKDLKHRKHMASVEKIEAEERRISYDGRSKFIKALIDENRVVETRKVVRDVGEIVATLASDLEGAKKRFPSIFANKSEKELMLISDTEIDSLKIRLHASSMKLTGKYGAEERKN